jgi:hypothetical protein
MFATLGFAALPRVPADMAPAFQALHQWLDAWRAEESLQAIRDLLGEGGGEDP